MGVYAGVMYGEYQLFGADASQVGKRMGIANSMASIANRVSYVLNLHGPSMTVDTMCSSSLTAIHLACQDLKLGRINLGIAGGVNVTIHPNKYLILSQGQFISNREHCQSFGVGGDGYIPGEGVGVSILKRLDDAERDRDHIYGVIKGSAVNHGGKTNGYSVPNPNAQQMVIARAIKEAQFDPRTISYIEAHGTGTKLGDPIEITGLTKAFEKYSNGKHSNGTQNKQYCWIGSVKSNIGHCESAAGIASVTKVLLQIQHGQIVPSLHSQVLNPYIDFTATQFSVNQELREWDRPVIDGKITPRVAGISSFGAGGSNAHVVVEEYIEEKLEIRNPKSETNKKYLIVLSAKNEERLKELAKNLLQFIIQNACPTKPGRAKSGSSFNLTDLAYTLQVGREGMVERLALIVGSRQELEDKLKGFVEGQDNIEDLYRGHVKRNKETLTVLEADEDMAKAIDAWVKKGKYTKLLDLWVKGLVFDWIKLFGESKPHRISLPTYPFARQRYWISDFAEENPNHKLVRHSHLGGGGSQFINYKSPWLHPLVHENTSNFEEQRFSSTFTGDEFFLADHVVRGNKVLPAVTYLEIAHEAVTRATGEFSKNNHYIRLKNVVWARPIAVNAPQQLHIRLLPEESGEIAYEIYTQNQNMEKRLSFSWPREGDARSFPKDTGHKSC